MARIASCSHRAGRPKFSLSWGRTTSSDDCLADGEEEDAGSRGAEKAGLKGGSSRTAFRAELKGSRKKVHGDELKISTSNIGIAVKDCSDGVVTGVEIDNVNFGVTVYQKKPEFGPATFTAKWVDFFEVNERCVVEELSELNLDDETIFGNRKNLAQQIVGK